MNHFIVHLMLALLHWLAVHTGTYIPAGQYSEYYNFWSGFGSDLMYLSVVVGLIHAWLNSRCHDHACLKHGRYEFHDTINNVTYKVCKRHHPGVPAKPSHLHFKQLHKRMAAQVYEH